MTHTATKNSRGARRRAGRGRANSTASRHPDTLRTSERSSLNRCRQRWDWGYNDRLHAKREKPALRFGTLIHKALEIWYNPEFRGKKLPLISDIFARVFDEELEQTQKDWMRWKDEDDEWHEYRELGMVMLEGYLEHFKALDDEYIVLAVEQRFSTPIWVPPGEPELSYPSPITYVGTIDRVLFHMPSRRLLFGDYKTTANDPTSVKHLGLDEQAGAYWAMGPGWIAYESPARLRKSIQKQVEHLPRAYRRAVEEWRFDGIIYDFLKKAMPDDRPVNEQGYAVNKPLKEELVAAAKTYGIKHTGLKVDELVEAIDGVQGEGWAYANLGEVSKKQPGPLFHREPVYRNDGDRMNVLKRVYEDAKEIGMMRQGQLAIKKSPDKFICIGCPFIDMCELHETGADWEAFRDGVYEVWNPYSTYEIEYDELN